MHDIVGAIAAGQNDDRHIRALADALAGLEAIDVGHHHVEQHHVEALVVEGAQGLDPILDGHHLVARVLERHLDERGDLRVVVGDENTPWRGGLGGGAVGCAAEKAHCHVCTPIV
jgi:hypothetical protein